METNITPFDLHRMFIGDIPPLFLLEIVFRTLIIYLYAVLLLRVMGKRGNKTITPVEHVVIVSLGSAAGDPMFYPNVPLVFAFVVITTIVYTSKLMGTLKQSFSLVSDALESKPRLLVDNGKIMTDILEKENYSKSQLFSQLRESGVKYLESVDKAIIEESGSISVFKKKKFSKNTNLLYNIGD